MSTRKDIQYWAGLAGILALVVAVLALLQAYFNVQWPGSDGMDPGWTQYDDYSGADTLDVNWWRDDTNQLCDLHVSEGKLQFDCIDNDPVQDLGATFHPEYHTTETIGVQALVRVDQAGGPFQLTTNWKCQDVNLERSYHLELGTDFARAVEYYPQEGWRNVELGVMKVTPGKWHWMQITRTNDAVEFSVDDKVIPLSVTPSFQACSLMNYWAFNFYMWKGGNRLAGQIDEVNITQGK